MSNENIIELLNSKFTAGDIMLFFLAILVIWIIVWKLLLEHLFFSCDVSSFWYSLYELGPIGTFGVMLFLGLLLVLFIASIQLIKNNGIKILLPLLMFWGPIITILAIIIKKLRKK